MYKLWQRFCYILAIGFGSGLAPKAPGTWGSVVGFILFLPLSSFSLWFFCIVVSIGAFLGIYLCEQASHKLNSHDHPAIVWDEIIGLWISYLPLIGAPLVWHDLLLGFFLFRGFDIVKPWPIRQIDRHVGGGFGIMLDDVLAGGLAALCLWMLIS